MRRSAWVRVFQIMSEGAGDDKSTGEAPTSAGVGESAPAVKRARYLHPLAYYPPHWQSLLGLPAPPVSERSLKGWIGAGRDLVPPELPPFDDERSLARWWSRAKTNRAPDWLVSLAARVEAHHTADPGFPPAPLNSTGISDAAPEPDALAGSELARAASSPTSAPSASAPTLPFLRAPTSSEPGPDSGYLGALQRVREAEASAGRLYTLLLAQAADERTPAADRTRLAAEAEQARRAWDELINRLRPMEKDSGEILAAAGLTWPRADVIASATVVHIALHGSIRAFWRRVRSRMRACATPDEEDALWSSELEKIFAALRANQFTAPVAPADDSAPTTV